MPLIECDHGCAITTMPNEPKHPVCNFINELFMCKVHWMTQLNLHLQVWENEDNRKMTINILLSIGTNLLLSSNTNIPMKVSFLAADAIAALENYDGTVDMMGVLLSRVVDTKRRDLGGGKMRDMLKFFSKRTSCSCLKELYSEARKAMPKTGHCFHCRKEVERRLLPVCSECKVVQYCSRECQVAHWPVHERFCGHSLFEYHV